MNYSKITIVQLRYKSQYLFSFGRIHLWVSLKISHFDSWPRKGLIFAEVLESESERNTSTSALGRMTKLVFLRLL